MNPERKVTIDASLFEAMAACYYGGGPDFWARTGAPRPASGSCEPPPVVDEPVDSEYEPPIVFNGDSNSPFDSSAMSRFAGPGMRVTPMDLAAEQTTTGDDDASESGSSEEG